MQVFCPHNSDIVSGEDIDFCGLRQEVSSCLVIVVRGQALTRGSLLLRAEMITSWTTPLSPVSPRRIKKIVTTWNLKIGGSWAEGKGGGRCWQSGGTSPDIRLGLDQGAGRAAGFNQHQQMLESWKAVTRSLSLPLSLSGPGVMLVLVSSQRTDTSGQPGGTWIVICLSQHSTW